MYKVLIFIIILTAGSIGQSYKQVKIYLTNKEDIRTLQSFNITVDHSYQTRDNAILTFLNEAEFNRLAMLNFQYEVLIDDWKSYYEKRERMNAFQKNSAIRESKNQFGVTNFNFGSMGGYYTYDEALQKLDEMKSLYPNLITAKKEIGKSVEGRSVFSVKISDNPDVDEDEPEVLYTALIHAREPESMMQMIYFMFYLLENYGADPEATYLVDNRELYFIPIINPDGYVYNQTQSPNGGGMWRKNRRNNGGGSFGVDLNRNFGPSYYWNAPNSGSSLTPLDETYRGVSPFSEPETENIANFIIGHKFKNALNYHTYGNDLIYPYGALEMETPDSVIFREFAADMTKLNRYTTGTDMSTVGYSTRGNSDDFMYDGDTSSIGKILAMTPEAGNGTDGFWPPENRIFPIAEENLFPNLYYAWVAGGYVSLAGYSFDREIVMPGEMARLSFVVKNKGLGDAKNVFVSLKADTSKIALFTESSIRNLNSRESGNNSAWFALNSNLKNGEIVRFVASTSLLGYSLLVPMSVDTIFLTVGKANIVFKDTSSSPSIKWNITSNVTQKWDVTSTSYNSIPNSFTDSPKGNYENNAAVVMTLKDSINLLGVANPKLVFWTKFDLENDWDCGKVEISSDLGKSWVAVGGKYANTAAGQGRQLPVNSLLYDGAQKEWVKEEIDLNAFAGKQIKIRFSVLSDEYVQKDGWYLDDISIVTYDNLTAVDGKGLNAPFNFSLSQNYPNPFNPSTIIHYQTATTGFVSLKIFDVLGNEVETLVNEVEAAGNHTVQLSGAKSRLASGVYFYRLKTVDFSDTKKMVLLR